MFDVEVFTLLLYTELGPSEDVHCKTPNFISSTGYYTYYNVIAGNSYASRNIYYRTTLSKWLIGVYGSTSGWWEGAEPSITSPTTFTFTVPEGSEVTGTNITVTYDQYVKGIDTLTFYVGNTGVFTP